MDQVREVLRFHHYAYRTERTYCQWILRFIRHFHCKRHPKDLGVPEIEAFLSHLASSQKVSASTQRQALYAIIFLYRDVLNISLKDRITPIRARASTHPPTVLTFDEVGQLLSRMIGTHHPMAQLIYGSGLRLMECVRLHAEDLEEGYGDVYLPRALSREYGS